MPDGRLRRAWALTMDGSTTSAAPVSPAGSWRIRSNAAGTAIEVSYNGAAYTTLSGSGSSVWSALTAPTAELTLNHADYKTIFNFDATQAEDCFVVQSATDAAGSGVVFYVRTQGASTTKAPLRVDAKGSIALSVDVNGHVGIGTGTPEPTYALDIRSGSLIVMGDTNLNLTQRTYGATSDNSLTLYRGRGTAASPTPVLSGDALGALYFAGQYDTTTGLGTTFNIGGIIVCEAQDNWASTNWPADLILKTKPVSGLAARTALRLTSDQRAGIGDNIAHADVTHRLTVVGDAKFTGQVQFSATATLAGLNVGSLAGDPSAPNNGDLWYDSTANELTARISGANVALGSGGGTPGGSGSEIQYRSGAATFGAVTGSSVSGGVISIANAVSLSAWNAAHSTVHPLIGLTNTDTIALDNTGRTMFAGNAPTQITNAAGQLLVAALAGGVRLDQVTDPAANKTYSMSTAGTDYTVQYLWDASSTSDLFTIANTSPGTGSSGALLMLKPYSKNALVVNDGANQFVLGAGGTIDTNGMITIRDGAGLGLRLFEGATNNVYIQYVGATPALRVIFNGGAAVSLVTANDIIPLAKGGTGVALSDPNADRIMFWDDSAGATAWLTLGTNLTITGTTLDASGGGSGKWNAITNPDGNLALTMAAYTTAFTWNAATSTNALFTIQNTTDDTGTGALLAVNTPGTSNAKTPFRVTAWTDRVFECGPSGGVTVKFFAPAASGSLTISRGRGTQASPTAVQSGDTLGALTFGGQYSSTIDQITPGASIQAQAVANFTATNDAQTDLIFTTKSTGLAAHIGLRITSDRYVGIGEDIAHTDVTHRLTVAGTAKIVSNSINSLEVNSSGQVGIGYLNTSYDCTIGADATVDVLIAGARTTGFADAAVLRMSKTDSATLASPGDVEGSEFIAVMAWAAYQSGAYRDVAYMRAQTGASFGASDYSGRFTWNVVPSGTTSAAETLVALGNQVLVQGGASGLDPATTFHVHTDVAATAAVGEITRWSMNSTGAPAAGFGLRHIHALESSTTTHQSAVYIDTRWQDATHASRTAVHSIKTVANAGTLTERQMLGGFKALADNTQTDLFSIVFGTGDHTAVGGFVEFVFIARQTTGSNQIQTYTKVLPFSAYHNAATNTGAATWGSEALTAGVTSSGGITYTWRINGSATMPQTGFNTATFQIVADSDLATVLDLVVYYNVYYTGQIDITLA